MSDAPARRAGVPARRGRPPLSSYPTADGLSRASNGASPRTSRTLSSGPPRKRGRPPRNAAPPTEPHMHPLSMPVAVEEQTPSSFTFSRENGSSNAPSRPTPAEPRPPALVFQCARCLTVVSDSFSWITAQRQLSMIVLKEATEKVAVIGPMITSSEPGLALGSTYSVLQCVKCMQQLGRRYHDTPRGLEEIREAFAFHVDAVIVYQLGSTSRQGHPTQIEPIKHSPNPSETASTAGPSQTTHHPEQSGQDQSATEMNKIRTLLMVLGERLLRVERHLHLDPPSPDHSQDTSTLDP